MQSDEKKIALFWGNIKQYQKEHHQPYQILNLLLSKYNGSEVMQNFHVCVLHSGIHYISSKL